MEPNAKDNAANDLKLSRQAYLEALRSGDEQAIKDTALSYQKAKDIHQFVSDTTDAQQADATYNNMKANYRPSKVDVSNEPDDTETPSDKPESKGSKKRGWQFSDTFYRDAIASLTGRPTGNRQDIRTATLDQQMKQKQNEAAIHDKDAQYHKQIGQRNEYEMAEKDARAADDATNRGKINQTGFSAGTASAALRTTSTADVQGARDYKDRNMQIGEQRADLADTNREDAIEAGGSSKEWRLGSRDYDNDLNKSGWLSRGGDDRTQQQPKRPNDTIRTQYDVEPEEPEEPEQPVQHDLASPQKVYNYITYGADQTSKNYNGANMDDDAWTLWKEWGSPTPLTAEEAQQYGGYDAGAGPLQEAVKQFRSDAYNKYVAATEDTRHIGSGNQMNANTPEQQAAIDNMRIDVQSNTRPVQQSSGRGGMSSNVPGYNCGTDNAKPGYAIVGEEGPELVKMKGGEQVIPTSDTEKILCDMRMKFIREDLDEGRGLQDYDLNWLLKQMGSKYEHEGQEYDYDSDDGWTEDILKGYADHIKNYIYNYKPEAQSIDSRIDPNEEHIGPMAQDIEQVNPACVKENEDGIKMVDASRLAMMNAGAIGDLARKLDGVLDRLDRLEGAR